MAKFRRRADFDIAAFLAATIRNANSTPAGMVRDFTTLNPFRGRPQQEKLSLREIRKAMTGYEKPA